MNKLLEEIFPQPPADICLSELDPCRIPEHVAVIMDGNGRWAKKRALNRLKGHAAGIEAVRETIRAANDVGVRYLTIYSFSTENWRRPADEVAGLMDLFARTMLAEVDALHEEQVRVMTIGRTDMLPEKTSAAFAEAWEKTKNNTGMTLAVAVNYGGRSEIIDGIHEYLHAAEVAAAEGREVPELSESTFRNYHSTRFIPDPDLLIRTSGELRVSNFLLWQIAYTEIYSTDVLWPDFDRYEFLRALLDYQKRNRRFGTVG